MAEQYNSRPSTLVNIIDPYLAWCFDETLFVWHSFVQEQLDKITHDKPEEEMRRRTQRLHEVLGVEPKASGFRDPAATFS